MPTAVDYVNRALHLLGAGTISALTPEDSPNAATAVQLYEPTLHELLARHPWRFAATRVQLSQLTDAPANTDWSYQYALPVGTLRVVRTDVNAGSWMLYRDPAAGYRRLYSNESVVWADLVLEPDASLFPPHFQAVLVARLAAALALPITRRAEIAQAYDARAADAESAAITQDWNEQPWPELDDGNVLVHAKYGIG